MSVAANPILAPQTGAGASSVVNRSVADGAFTVVAGGLGASETVTAQIMDASGNWQTVPAAIAPVLNNTTAALTLTAPGIYRFSKTATASAVGIVLYSY